MMTIPKKDMISLPSRRQLLIKGAAGAFGLAALGMKGSVLARNMIEDPTPGVTEGPYWVDELLNRSDIRTDPATGIIQPGFPLRLGINVSLLDAAGNPSPLPGAFVDIWHCNALGVYSDEQVEDTVGEKFLRGYQVTDKHGNVKFISIYPGWYVSRTVHVHLRVRIYDATKDTVTYNFTTQLFFEDSVSDYIFSNFDPYILHPNRDTTNATDSVFTGGSFDGSVTAEVGEDLLARLSRNKKYAIASFNVFIDPNDTANEGGSGGGGPGGGGPPPGGGGPGGGGPPPGGTPAGG